MQIKAALQLVAAEARATDERKRREDLAASAIAVGKKYESLKREFAKMRQNTSSVLKTIQRDAADDAAKALGAVEVLRLWCCDIDCSVEQSLDARVLESTLAITGLQKQLTEAEDKCRES